MIDSHGYQPDSDGYQPDSDGYQPDSDGYQPDSDGYQPDSDGYQPDSDGYQPEGDRGSGPSGSSWPRDAHPELCRIFEEAASSRSDEWRTECLRHWQHYADLVAPAYGDKLLVVRLWCQGVLDTDDWPPRRRPPVPSLPSTAAPGDNRRSRRALVCQLNVRLSSVAFERLAATADCYGMSPTTLARLFISRGLEAARDHSR